MSVIPKRKTLRQEDINIELMQEASLIMAEVVKLYGDAYLSIFVRILKEIEQQKEKQNYKKIALQMINDRS
ncbi:hypothetical protein [Winogradskyella sp. SYSU M77433]|uniref:hypothetical protein n=1 Tax=Winogradskyella sp. SYSU M77433 TaxID=3042722 RepID=UPI0024816859|nr:hypothetical protein [Winogradskyella sp. SYSU M77433]MDH7911356.1 hypothetical protein [Winogradskyella sp. SYSU M77433]